MLDGRPRLPDFHVRRVAVRPFDSRFENGRFELDPVRSANQIYQIQVADNKQQSQLGQIGPNGESLATGNSKG